MQCLQERTEQPRWTLLFYIFYTAFLFVQPAATHAGWRQWCEAVVALLVFVALYSSYIWLRGPITFWCTLGIAILGFVYAPFNSGAICFFIYAAALFGYLFQPMLAFAVLAVLLAGIGVEAWLLHSFVWVWAPTVIMTLAVGSVNIHEGAQKRANKKLQLAQEEIERLAKVAERERIARDLHDVLGHTLSVIVLKSELASKLIERDVECARREIVELEQIAREALKEVRQAIGGYRVGSLAEELARARATLDTAGVQVDAQPFEDGHEHVKLSPAQETVLALAMREAVTNVVRHAEARSCRIRFGVESGRYRLEIADDGCGGSPKEGNGLRGMRERIEALHGTLERDGACGMRLSVTLPLGARGK